MYLNFTPFVSLVWLLPISLAAVVSSEVGMQLAPHILWNHFYQISKIPRPSKFESQVIDYIRSIGHSKNFVVTTDRTGNLLIKRPGSGGGENAPAVLIQGHVDMVTEKNSAKKHDFFKDPIKLVQRDDWMYADSTTLGADNGIGVAAALSLLEAADDATLPPLECLFTVDEETGLTGAKGLEPSTLGITSKMLLNLDTEEWGVVYIGCAGGGNTVLTVPCNCIPLPSDNKFSQATCKFLQIVCRGLVGGHSGINIHEQRGNAVQLLAGVLQRLLDKFPDHLHLTHLSGGDKHNAIPREATGTVMLTTYDTNSENDGDGDSDNSEFAVLKAVLEAIQEEREHMIHEYGELEKNLDLSLISLESEDISASTASYGTASPASPAATVIDRDSAVRLLSLLRLLPNGALKYSYSVKDPEVFVTAADVFTSPATVLNNRHRLALLSGLLSGACAGGDELQRRVRVACCSHLQSQWNRTDTRRRNVLVSLHSELQHHVLHQVRPAKKSPPV